MTLRDPDKRERYDRGESEPVDDRMARVSMMLCSLFCGVMDQMDVETTDMVGEVRKNLEQMTARSNAQSVELAKTISKADRAIKRLRYGGTRGDVIVTMLNGAIDQHRKTEAAQATERETIAAALVYLDDYSYSADKRPGGHGEVPSWMMNQTTGRQSGW